MATPVLPDDKIFRSRPEAMRYLKAYKKGMRDSARALTRDITSLGPDLLLPVAHLAEALSRGWGNFHAEHMSIQGDDGLGRGMVIKYIDLDDDVFDAFDNGFGEDVVEAAADWLLRRLQGETAVFTSWALGPVHFNQAGHVTALDNRILFHLRARRIEAVLSHMDWADPACLHYYLKGSKRSNITPLGQAR
jgi:hypothetical protein